ncbi:MAG: hypothetical protein HFI93_02540 [Lachnospiraceae bacterium]|nr:hypothetical protein [Lachnospiraceae bacterium]
MLFYTSVNAAYLPKARVLGYSLKKWNPTAKLYIVLSDEIPRGFRIEDEPFDGILLSEEIELTLDMSREFWIFLHDVTELCTAVKGWAALELLRRTNAEEIIYLDPDMLVCHSLEPLKAFLREHDIVVTPHRLAPEPLFDQMFYGDQQFYTRGGFNLGFLAVKNSEEGVRFLKWWAGMLERYCYVDDPEGLFTDQKLMDIAPCFFGTLFICRDETYNVSWWNLTQREVSGDAEALYVNGKRVRLYHFSNVESGLHEEIIRKYCADNVALRALYNWYLEEQKKMGYQKGIVWDWKFDHYDNGEKIRPITREMTRKRKDMIEKYKNSNPFQTGEGTLFACYQKDWPEYLEADTGKYEKYEKKHERIMLLTAYQEKERLLELVREKEKSCKIKTLAIYDERNYLRKKLKETETAYGEVINSNCWKLTGPIRRVLDWAKGYGRK